MTSPPSINESPPAWGCTRLIATIRAIFKWAGPFACCAIIYVEGCSVASLGYQCAPVFYLDGSIKVRSIFTRGGSLVFRSNAISASEYSNWRIVPRDHASLRPFWYIGEVGRESKFGVPQIVRRFLTIGRPALRTDVVIHFWFIFVFLASPTGIIWLSDITRFVRRNGPGSCQECGYCLLGNVSGICPECGTPIPEEQKQAIVKATTIT